MSSKKKALFANAPNFLSVSEALQKLYKSKLQPLEEHYKFHELISYKLENSHFENAPIVVLIGQYSTGKTTLLKYILGQDFAGMRIGPEPTTDGFHALMYGDQERVVPGNALVVDSNKPFQTLSSFGNNFLNRFQCTEVNNEVLRNITFIDTPGILSGDKQTVSRGYDIVSVIKWFAERADRIILLFDAHKLDISDEFKRVIEILRPYDFKLRLLLNKADAINTQQLMRVFGALMFSLGKVITTPEVPKVYIGSFWDQNLVNDDFRGLFTKEQTDFFDDLSTLPKQATTRKLNDFIRRARTAKILAYIVSALKAEMPMFNKDKKKKELLNDLPNIFRGLTQKIGLSIGDFPDPVQLKEKMEPLDFSRLKPFNKSLVNGVEEMLEKHVPKLLDMIENENKINASNEEDKMVTGGVFDQLLLTKTDDTNNPFTDSAVEGINYGKNFDYWPVNDFRIVFDEKYDRLEKTADGLITGSVARQEILKSKLPTTVLGLIWRLSDYDKDGKLNKNEWALCQYLVDLKLKGHDLPHELPFHLIPPN